MLGFNLRLLEIQTPLKPKSQKEEEENQWDEQIQVLTVYACTVLVTQTSTEFRQEPHREKRRGKQRRRER